MPYRDKVAFARSTLECVKRFQDGLYQLEHYYHLPLAAARAYLLTGVREERYDEEAYVEVDRIQAIRATGILGEMKYCLAQARKHGITLPESLRRGQDLGFGITGELLDKVPSLGIYTHFLWLSLEELEAWQPRLTGPAGGDGGGAGGNSPSRTAL